MGVGACSLSQLRSPWFLQVMTHDFLLKPGHFGYYASRFLILFKSFISPLLTSTWHKKGVATLVLPSGHGSPDSSVGVGRGVFFVTAVQRWEFRFPIRLPLIPALRLGERGAPRYCSPHACPDSTGRKGEKVLILH